MSARAHFHWLRWASLASFALGCQVVFGDFSIDTNAGPIELFADCRPNAYRCVGATLELCADDRSGYQALQECASSNECDPTAGACRRCEAGEFACNQHVLRSCSPAQTWLDADVCDSAQFCQVTPDRRAGSCASGCEPGSVRCEGDVFERCALGGERWESLEICGPGRCSVAESGDESAGCLPSACEGDTCPPRECKNGELRCDPTTGLTLQRCSSAGQFVTLEACVASVLCRADLGVCLPPACERGEKRCLGQKFQSCRGDRTWFQTTKECAAGETCDPIAGCVAGTCVNDAARCNGATFERCVNGVWSPRQVCATKDLCSAATGCAAPVCGGALESYRCHDNNVVQQCKPGRDDWEEINFCTAGEKCVTQRPFCVPDL
jgi:hypothetical protein